LRTQFINEQTMMIYFENEISESTFKKVTTNNSIYKIEKFI